MTRVGIWFERKFEFGYPVALLPNVLARLRGTAARLEEVLRASTKQALTRKPEGKWSAQEHAGHLADLEPLWLDRVRDFEAGSTELVKADLTNRKTEEANHNGRAAEEIVNGFRRARTELLKRVEALDGAVFERSIPHPRLNTAMQLTDFLYFVAEHDDHHLARIWELVSGARELRG